MNGGIDRVHWHGKVVCRECGKTVLQCRCMEGGNNVTYTTCTKCAGGKKKEHNG